MMIIGPHKLNASAHFLAGHFSLNAHEIFPMPQ
jgi:hypothetical protein